MLKRLVISLSILLKEIPFLLRDFLCKDGWDIKFIPEHAFAICCREKVVFSSLFRASGEDLERLPEQSKQRWESSLKWSMDPDCNLIFIERLRTGARTIKVC